MSDHVTDSITHAECPTYPGQSFNKSTGACSCGALHRDFPTVTDPTTTTDHASTILQAVEDKEEDA